MEISATCITEDEERKESTDIALRQFMLVCIIMMQEYKE